jgi:hypothetical protein
MPRPSLRDDRPLVPTQPVEESLPNSFQALILSTFSWQEVETEPLQAQFNGTSLMCSRDVLHLLPVQTFS